MDSEHAFSNGGDSIQNIKASLPYQALFFLSVLSCCNCDRVPGLLFWRPFNYRRRWNSDGELTTLPPLPIASIAPLAIFREIEPTDRLAADLRDVSFDRAEIGVYSEFRTTHTRTFLLARDLRILVKQGIVKCRRDPLLSFEINPQWKSALSHSIRLSERLENLCILTTLVSISFPDLFAEGLWTTIWQYCRELVEETVVPFLTVVSGDVIQSYLDPDSLGELLRFLAVRSIHRGFTLEPTLPFENDTAECIESLLRRDERPTTMMQVVELKDHLAMLLVKSPATVNGNHSKNLNSLYSRTKSDLSGLLAIAVFFMSVTSEGIPQHSILEDVARHCFDSYPEKMSTLEKLSRILLITRFASDSRRTAEPRDLNVMLALAFAFFENENFTTARSILHGLVEAVHAPLSGKSMEYQMALTEFAFCLIHAGDPSKAEKVASHGQQRGNRKLMMSFVFLCIVKADSLIAQEKYAEAEDILTKILRSRLDDQYVKLATGLRLNKIHRRIGQLKSLEMSLTSPLAQIGSSRLGKDPVSIEWTEEVAVTALQLKLGRISSSQDSNRHSLLEATQALDNLEDRMDWRSRYAIEQCVNLYLATNPERHLRTDSTPSLGKFPSISKTSTQDPFRGRVPLRQFLWQRLASTVPKNFCFPPGFWRSNHHQCIDTSFDRPMNLIKPNYKPVGVIFPYRTNEKAVNESLGESRHIPINLFSTFLENNLSIAVRRSRALMAYQSNHIPCASARPATFFWASCAIIVKVDPMDDLKIATSLEKARVAWKGRKEGVLVVGYIRYHRPRIFQAKVSRHSVNLDEEIDLSSSTHLPEYLKARISGIHNSSSVVGGLLCRRIRWLQDPSDPNSTSDQLPVMSEPFWHILFGPELLYGKEDEVLREYSLSDAIYSSLITYRSQVHKEPLSEFDWSFINPSPSRSSRRVESGIRSFPADSEPPPPYSPSSHSSADTENDGGPSLPPDIHLSLSQDNVSELSSDSPSYTRKNTHLLKPNRGSSPIGRSQSTSLYKKERPKHAKRFSFNLPIRTTGTTGGALSLTLSNPSERTFSSGISSLITSDRRQRGDSTSSKARTGSPPRYPTPPTPENEASYTNGALQQSHVGSTVPQERHLSASSIPSSVSLSMASFDLRG